MSYTSELTKLIHDSRADRERFVASRDYSSAKALRASLFDTAAQRHNEQQAATVDRHKHELNRLVRARELAVQQAHSDVSAKIQAIDQEWEAKYQELKANHAELLEQYEVSEMAKEQRRPVVLSTYVRDLQRSEKHLARFDQYDEADQAHRKIKHLEVGEVKQLQEEAIHRVRTRVETKRQLYEEEEKGFLAKMRNTIRIAEFRGDNENRRTQNQFEHTRRDLMHAQARELQQNPLLVKYQRPPKMRRKVGTAPQQSSSSSTRQATPSLLQKGSELAGTASMRGTTYLLKLQGSRFRVPSLCDVYGDRLDQGGQMPAAPKKVFKGEGGSLSSGVRSSLKKKSGGGGGGGSLPIIHTSPEYREA